MEKVKVIVKIVFPVLIFIILIFAFAVVVSPLSDFSQVITGKIPYHNETWFPLVSLFIVSSCFIEFMFWLTPAKKGEEGQENRTSYSYKGNDPW